jgi:hypothetical protein
MWSERYTTAYPHRAPQRHPTWLQSALDVYRSINALAATVNGLYKAELVHARGPWRGRDDLELATLAWVHWFNHQRLFGALGYVPPAEYEAAGSRQPALAGVGMTCSPKTEPVRSWSPVPVRASPVLRPRFALSYPTPCQIAKSRSDDFPQPARSRSCRSGIGLVSLMQFPYSPS